MTGGPRKRPWPFEAEGRAHVQAPNQMKPAGVLYANGEENAKIGPTICFGSIVDVRVQLFQIHQLGDISVEGSVPSFTIVQEGEYYSLRCRGTTFARPSKRFCKDLHELADRKQIRMQGHASDKDWNEAISSSSRGNLTFLIVEIMLFGAQEDAKETGRILSKSNIFLQRPQYDLSGVEYYNPHLLRIEGFSEKVPASWSLWTRESSVNTPDNNAEGIMRDSDSHDVDSILDSLSHHIYLPGFSADPSVKSTLKDYQKEAVDFIFQIEAGHWSPERSLWRYNDTESKAPFYEHVLTGAKRPNPAEARGGIIADEMGLGKTLVMLSIIASSTKRADNYAAERPLPSTQPRRNRRSKATLIIAPSARGYSRQQNMSLVNSNLVLINTWVDEIRKHIFPGSLPFHLHLGPSRHAETELLYVKTIVFTTYATAAVDFSCRDATLSNIDWFRIILDEAHDIRNRLTQQFDAVAPIPAQHRWCLTGTPIQNSLNDLGALVSLLKVPMLENPPTFRKFVTNALTSTSGNRFENLQVLLQSICLRRTRRVLKDLPEPIIIPRVLPLTPSERTEYHSLIQECKRDIDAAVARCLMGKIKSTVLGSLLKLRLFCNNGRANAVPQLRPTGLPVASDEALSFLEQNGENICAYCSGTIHSIGDSTRTDGGMFMPQCSHLACRNCKDQKASCPTCSYQDGSMSVSARLPISSQILSENSTESSNTAQPQQYPSKLLGLLSDIRKDPNQKSIIFSCWTKTLKIVSELLCNQKLRHHMIDGSRSLNYRTEVLKDFCSSSGANILLMTLGTGAVGLNLAAASRIYLLEPQWNPSIESQAIGRALRLNQESRVTIFRYVMSQTVEESSVLSQQKGKLELVRHGFPEDKDMHPERFQALLDVFGAAKESVLPTQ